MKEASNTSIIVKTTIQAPIEKVWNYWTMPEHVMKWNHASDDWHTPYAENNFTESSKFLYRMAAKDGSYSFDFTGTYTEIILHQSISYILDDGRKVTVNFKTEGNLTNVTEIFEPENINPVEMQKSGWQIILDNFKKYVEAH